MQPPPPFEGPGDAALLAILMEPLPEGTTATDGFAAKEQALGAAFLTLSVVEAHYLQRRLAYPREGDVLAMAFMRLTAERRKRLLDFLADARRRSTFLR